MYIDFKEALDIELKDLHYLEKRHDLAPKHWYEMYGFLIIPIECKYYIKTQFNRIFGDFPTKEEAEEYILLYLKNNYLFFEIPENERENFECIAKSWEDRIYEDKDDWRLHLTIHGNYIENPEGYIYHRRYYKASTAIADIAYRKRHRKPPQTEYEKKGINPETGRYISRYFAKKANQERKKVVKVGNEYVLMDAVEYYRYRKGEK
jgi:hypothetical protein